MEDATNTSMACAMQKSTSLFFGLTVTWHTSRKSVVLTSRDVMLWLWVQSRVNVAIHALPAE